MLAIMESVAMITPVVGESCARLIVIAEKRGAGNR